MCDLSKLEYDPDTTVTITFKKAGRGGKVRRYDLSPESAAELEQALVGNVAHKLVPAAASTIKDKPSDPRKPPDNGDDIVRVGDAEFNIDDDELINKKEAERKAYNEQLDTEAMPADEADDIEEAPKVTREQKECVHANKTPSRLKVVGGKRGFWRQCKECGKLIKAKSKRARAAYGKATAPEGTSIQTHPTEERKR